MRPSTTTTRWCRCTPKPWKSCSFSEVIQSSLRWHFYLPLCHSFWLRAIHRYWGFFIVLRNFVSWSSFPWKFLMLYLTYLLCLLVLCVTFDSPPPLILVLKFFYLFCRAKNGGIQFALPLRTTHVSSPRSGWTKLWGQIWEFAWEMLYLYTSVPMSSMGNVCTFCPSMIQLRASLAICLTLSWNVSLYLAFFCMRVFRVVSVVSYPLMILVCFATVTSPLHYLKVLPDKCLFKSSL